MKYFKPYELVDKLTYEALGDDALRIFPPEALEMLDDLRAFLGSSILVNNWIAKGAFQWRGFRTVNCAIGAKGSYHRKGMAFDCNVKGYTAEEARQYIVKNQDHPLLKHITRLEAGVPWLHLDMGTVPEGKQRIYLFKV
jgi:hypothetical protein